MVSADSHSQAESLRGTLRSGTRSTGRGAAVFAGIICLAYLKIMAKRQFRGMSGDLSGWFLQVSELIMLLSITVLSHVPK